MEWAEASLIAVGRLMRLIGFYGTGLPTLFPEEAEAEVEVVRRDDYHHHLGPPNWPSATVLARKRSRRSFARGA